MLIVFLMGTLYWLMMRRSLMKRVTTNPQKLNGRNFLFSLGKGAPLHSP